MRGIPPKAEMRMPEQDYRSLLAEAADRLAAMGVPGGDPLLVRLNEALGRSGIEPETEPGLAGKWKGGLAPLRRRYAKEAERAQSSVARYASGIFGTGLEAEHREAEKHLSEKKARLARVDDVLKRIDLGVDALLLPIGTVVRLKPGADAEIARYLKPPVPGTLGVVAGYQLNRECPLTVALPRDVKDVAGDVFRFDGERPITFALAADQVEVISYGDLVGIGTNEAIGYVPTHARDDGGDEMLVEAEGRTWRLFDNAGEPECLGASRAEEDMGWLVRLGGTALSP